MSEAVYKVQVDWDNDGDFLDTGEDVTSDVRAESLRVERGHAASQTLAPPQAGVASFVLNNDDSTYHPENSGSALTGNLLPGRTVNVQATFETEVFLLDSGTLDTNRLGGANDLFTGFIDDFAIDSNPGQRQADFSALDGLATLVGKIVSTILYDGISTGTAVGHLLDAVGWPADDRDIDDGQTILDWWWVEQGDAFGALKELVASEGPGVSLYVTGEGILTFKDRHHRFLETRAITSQATFRGAGTEPTFGIPFNYQTGWRNVANDVAIRVERRKRQPLQVVWIHTNDTFVVAPSATETITAQADNPFIDAVSPETFVLGSTSNGKLGTNRLGGSSSETAVDFNVTQGGISTVSVDRTSAQSITISITATAAGAVIENLALRAKPVKKTVTVIVEDEDATSIAAYGRRSLSRPKIMTNLNVARDIAAAYIGRLKDPLVTVGFPVNNGHDTRLREALSREISDRVTVIEADAGLNRDFHIENIRHTVRAAGKSHTTTFSCRDADAGLVSATDIFILDDVSNGVLGTNKLGY